MTQERLTTVDDLILAHAAGALPEPLGLVVATHLALRPENLAFYHAGEALGGALLDSMAPAELSEDGFARLLARLDMPPEEEPAARPATGPDLPSPLASYVGASLHSLTWRDRGSYAEVALPLDRPGFHTRLIRIRAGKAMPEHTHAGQEIMVVLDGGFSDGPSCYGKGDVAIAAAGIGHGPLADKGGDCLCLSVIEIPEDEAAQSLEP